MRHMWGRLQSPLQTCSAQTIHQTFQLAASPDLGCLLLWSSGPSDRESIWLGGVSSGSMDEREVKPGQEEGPACLPVVQVLGLLEVCEVLMVIKDPYCVLGPFQNMGH